MVQLNLLDSSPLPEPSHKADSAYKTISEVSQILGVPQHVLRFWESNFPQLTPSRMRGSRRYYRPEDVTLLQNIKTLLYTKGFTIKGARKFLKSKELIVEEITPLPTTQPDFTVASEPASENSPNLHMLIDELRAVKSMLKTLL